MIRQPERYDAFNMKPSRYISAIVIVAAVAGIAAAGVWFVRNRPLPVQLAATETNVAIQVFGLGTVEARISSVIGFEVAAALVELAADHGDKVKRGDRLAGLHAAEQEARVTRAEASVHSAEAVLARSQTMVDRQAAVLAQKDEVNRRQQELVRKNVVSIEKAEEAAKEVKVAEAEHALAIADVAVARSALETARADLLREQVILDKYRLLAPFDGLVVERHRELGAAVKAGDPVFTLIDPASVWVLAHVEESRAGAIAVGQRADVRLRSLPGKVFPAKVARIGIESDRVSEERRVWVKCEQCPETFHIGEQAEVIITTATLGEALLVPELMVSGFDGHRGLAWVAEHGVARRMPLTFSHRTLDGKLVVEGGKPAGVEMIAGPITGLGEGRAVTIAGGMP